MKLPEKGITGIYKITSPSKKVYIGQAKCIRKRWMQYNRTLAKGQVKLSRSFLSYGVKKHDFKIIHECEIEDLNRLERYYQELYNCIDEGLNCVLQESEERPRILSEETRRKLSGKIIRYVNKKTKIHKEGLLIDITNELNVKAETVKKRLIYDLEVDNHKVLKDYHFEYVDDFLNNKTFKPKQKNCNGLKHHEAREVKATNTKTKEVFVKNMRGMAKFFNMDYYCFRDRVRHNYIFTLKEDKLKDWIFEEKDFDNKNKLYKFDVRRFYLDLYTGIYYYSALEIAELLGVGLEKAERYLIRKKIGNLVDNRFLILKNTK